MGSNGNSSDQIDVKIEPLIAVESKTSVVNCEVKEEEDETATLLPPRRGGLARKVEKPQRKVMWTDNFGNKLAQVLEYQQSDASDTDEDEESDSCFCRPYVVVSSSRFTWQPKFATDLLTDAEYSGREAAFYIL